MKAILEELKEMRKLLQQQMMRLNMISEEVSKIQQQEPSPCDSESSWLKCERCGCWKSGEYWYERFGSKN